MMSMQMRQLAAKASSADGVDKLRVMTYNVLAQCYVRSTYFPYCKSTALRWKNRSKQLEKVFNELPVRPDVICLQEVDQYDEFWSVMMKALGYTGIFVKKSSTKKDGVAIFWQANTLTLVKHQEIALDNAIGDESDCSEDVLARTQRGSVGLITHFQTPSAIGGQMDFVLATTHLFWDPAQEDVKLLQTQRMARQLEMFTSGMDVPVLFAGDFNSLPDSKVYRFLIDRQHFQSAYAQYNITSGAGSSEPSFTNVNGAIDGENDQEVPNFIGTLDYIFYKSSRLRPAALLEIMSLADATKEISLPSTFSPSDHLPLLCEFHLEPPSAST